MKPDEREDLDQLRAQVQAHKHMIALLLIVLHHKGVLTHDDIEQGIEASLAALAQEAAGEPLTETVMNCLEDFRTAALGA